MLPDVIKICNRRTGPQSIKIDFRLLSITECLFLYFVHDHVNTISHWYYLCKGNSFLVDVLDRAVAIKHQIRILFLNCFLICYSALYQNLKLENSFDIYKQFGKTSLISWGFCIFFHFGREACFSLIEI